MKELEKQLMQSQIEVQEDTFMTLGKELHDNIGQLLSSSKMLLGVTMRNTHNSPDTLNTAYETLSTAIIELRSLSRSLDSQWLRQFNLIENLKTEVIRHNITPGLRIHFSHPDTLPLNSDQQILLFRIVQEAMQNAIKHAGAANINITMAENPARLDISVADDGKGFDPGSAKKGAGLNNIRHRSHALGGTARWQSTPAGTTLYIQIPVQNEKP